MKISFSSKGDFEGSLDWLKKVSKSTPSKALESIGSSGTKSLASNTPKDTGKTASGWEHNVTVGNGVSEVSWVNRAHPSESVNVAKLIDQGHGTRNGGYVQPRPYIKKSMDDIFKTAGDKIAKELIE